MRFNFIDWSSLALVSAIAFAASHVALSLILVSAPTTMVLVSFGLVSVLLFLFFLYPLAPWLILRHRVDDLRLTRWLLANAFGLILALTLILPYVALVESQVTLQSPGRAGAVRVLLKWMTTIAACVAYYLPPGLLLQRLSGTSAWPFITAGAAFSLFASLMGPAAWSWARGSPGLAAALGFGFGAIHGLTLGAGLFLMSQRSAASGP
jgi:hypothetical protein